MKAEALIRLFKTLNRLKLVDKAYFAYVMEVMLREILIRRENGDKEENKTKKK